MVVRFNRHINAHVSPRDTSAANGSSTNDLPLRVQYSSTSSSGVNAPILGEIGFGTLATASSIAPHPRAIIGLRPLDEVPSNEFWLSDLPVAYGQRDGVQYAVNDEYLFGVVNETAEVTTPAFEERVKAIYDAIFALTESEDRTNLLRMWNYFPAMNEESQGLENYQRFCRARSLAFQNRYKDFVYRLPSASAIGTLSGATAIYFIAARSPGVHRENPRQLSAYNYPSQYGPRSPSFARATLKRVGSGEMFFISGTASIVGHRSLHSGDVRAQTDEALCNIEALIDSTRRDETTQFRGMRDLNHIKVYVRRPADLPLVREVITQRVDPQAHVRYLQGDVCRSELLVEIEATLFSG